MTLTFEGLGLIPEILQTVAERGYTEPTAIQAQAIPHLLSGRDVMGQAQTGTGKTAAFTLPMLQQIEDRGLQTLILTPTRELAIQTADNVYQYGHKLGVRVLPVYGGAPYNRQIKRLKQGMQVVVGTPGRTLDLIKKGALDLSGVRFVILDEADEMLKMGFIDDVEAILGATPADTRQTALFSATLSNDIRRLGTKYMNDPLVVAIEPKERTVENVVQRYYVVNEHDKVAAVSRLLEVEEMQNTLVFARTKVGTAELAETLKGRGYPAEAIHGDLPQNERERILGRFRRGQSTILVATDVVARGVDIPDVTHVINFDIPAMPAEYVHRIGRTGRAGRDGDAITLISPRQFGQLKRIESFTRKRMTRAELPSREEVQARRDELFRAEMIEKISAHAGDSQVALLEELNEMGYTPEMVAAAAIKLLRASEEQRPLEHIRDVKARADVRTDRSRSNRSDRSDRRSEPRNTPVDRRSHEQGMVRLQMSIGRKNGVKPSEIVYTVASQANIPGRAIGAINIRQLETYVDVPEDHVKTVLKAMKDCKLRGREMNVVVA